jgi:hypothetical protein
MAIFSEAMIAVSGLKVTVAFQGQPRSAASSRIFWAIRPLFDTGLSKSHSTD